MAIPYANIRPIPCKFPQDDLVLFLANSGLISTDVILIHPDDAYRFRPFGNEHSLPLPNPRLLNHNPFPGADRSGNFWHMFVRADSAQAMENRVFGYFCDIPLIEAWQGTVVPPEHIGIESKYR